MRVSVIGAGYLGATHAVCLAALGHDVLAVDVDRARIASLAAGRLPFHEPGLTGLLRTTLATGRLRFGHDTAEAGEFADLHFLCVGTPQQPDSPAADVSQLEAAVRALAPALTRATVVVGKSTVPVGTADRLACLLRSLAPVGDAAEVAWNPEFLREGYAVEDSLRPERLVFGTASRRASDRLHEVYAPLLERGVPLVETDLCTAELVKVAANGYLATKLSYVNAMAEVCEAAGADVRHLVHALSLDSRIGGRYLAPGLGFGGGCLPKDIRAFAHRAEEIGAGAAVRFLHEVDAVNLRRRTRAVELVRHLAGGVLAGTRVCVLGASFKPDSDDVRDSPALAVVRALVHGGAQVAVFDPQAAENARRVVPEARYAPTVGSAAVGADVVAVLTDWEQFRALDPATLGAIVRRKALLDARHLLDAERWQCAGWNVAELGVPVPPVSEPLAPLVATS
ncbi:MAG: UDP-glucose/GDP-mannose dehydrogenase family protein [Nocardioidaceae bacterium]|nr:UDP-glucose/GDP-mannose dehydrogenase family protein [Nocardioidaceae bacterium]